MMFLLSILFGFIWCDVSKCLDNDEMVEMFGDFVTKHEKVYESDSETSKRYFVFCQNVLLLEQMKQDAENDEEWDADWMGITEFMDLTKSEFQQKYLSTPFDAASNCLEGEKTDYKFGSVKDIPTDWNWNDHGAVTGVKNQRECGSCWSFSATGNMEGQWFLKGKHPLTSFSEQQIINCCTTAEGCLGGLMDLAFEYVIEAGGIESEEKYPYKGWLEEKCKFDKSDVVANFTSYQDLPEDEDQLMEWCYANGPIAVAMDATPLQFYLGGVFDPPSILCPAKRLDHGVLIVGFGVEDGLFGKKNYWVVKNSWGDHWGEKGFFKMIRGSGKCGINTCASTIVV